VPAPAPAATAQHPRENGIAPATAMEGKNSQSLPNGIPAPAPARAPAPSPAVPVPVVRRAPPPQYEPAPNEIMRVTLLKEKADDKLGIWLSGSASERPRVTKLSPGKIAALSGSIFVDDVFLKVNGRHALGHENTTSILKAATGYVRIELYRVKLPAQDGSSVIEALTDASTAVEGEGTAPAVAASEPNMTAPAPRPNAWTNPSRAAAARPAASEAAASPAPAAAAVAAAADAAASAVAPAASPPASAVVLVPPAPSPAAAPSTATVAAPAAPAAAPAAAAVSVAAVAPAAVTPMAVAASPAAPVAAPVPSIPAPVPAPAATRAPAWHNPTATAVAVGAPLPQQSTQQSMPQSNATAEVDVVPPRASHKEGHDSSNSADGAGADASSATAVETPPGRGGRSSNKEMRGNDTQQPRTKKGQPATQNAAQNANTRGGGNNQHGSAHGCAGGSRSVVGGDIGAHCGAPSNGIAPASSSAAGGAEMGLPQQMPHHACGQVPAPGAGMVFRPGYAAGQMPVQSKPQPLHTELMLINGDDRVRSHREALKHRLQMSGGMALEELEHAVRMMLLSGRFSGTQGIPETMLIEFLPQKFIMPPSPFRTIAEMSACLPWLLRVHQAMQFISQMPNGLMTVQRLICPAASPENGGLAAEGGVLAVDWMMIEQVMSRPEMPREEMFRPGMAGDPRFPRGAMMRNETGADGAPAPEGDLVAKGQQSQQMQMQQPTQQGGQPPPPSAPPPFGPKQAQGALRQPIAAPARIGAKLAPAPAAP